MDDEILEHLAIDLGLLVHSDIDLGENEIGDVEDQALCQAALFLDDIKQGADGFCCIHFGEIQAALDAIDDSHAPCTHCEQGIDRDHAV